MQKLNFIQPLSHKQLQEFNTWYLVSVICISGVLLAVTGHSIYKIYTLHLLHQKQHGTQQELRSVKHAISQLEEQQKADLNTLAQLTKIAGYCHTCKNPATYLTHIAQVIPNNACLTTLTCTKKKLSLHGYAETFDAVSKFAQQLNASTHFKEVSIVALNPVVVEMAQKNKLYSFVLNGQQV